MTLPLRRVVLAALAVVGLATMRMGTQVHYVIFDVAVLLCAGVIATSVYRRRPDHPEVWLGFFLTMVIFLVSFVVRTVWSAEAIPRVNGDPHFSDYADVLALAIVMATLFRLGQVRNDHSDSMVTIDAAIIAGGSSAAVWIFQLLPTLSNPVFVSTGRALSLVQALIGIGIIFSLVRVSLTATHRTTSSRALAFAGLFSMLAQLSADGTTALIGPQLLTFATFGVILLAYSAWHPSMTLLSAHRPWTASPSQPIVSTKRAIAMMIALLTAPVGMLAELALRQYNTFIISCLVCSWLAVTAFVMLRVMFLFKAREQMAELDQTVAKTVSSFVAAHSVEDTYAMAVRGMLDLVDDDDHPTAAIISAVAGSHDWMVVAALGKNASRMAGATIDDSAFRALLANCPNARRYFISQFAPDSFGVARCMMMAEVASENATAGALVLMSTQPLSPLIAGNVLSSLATGVALARETSSLAETVQRQRTDQRFRSLVEKARDLILVAQPNGSLSFVSPAAEALFGIGMTHLRDITRHLSQSDANALNLLLRAATTTPTNETIEFQVQSRGETQWFEVSARSHLDDDTVNGIVINARDITDRKNLEESLRHRALHDDLTGIANRVLFRETLQHALHRRHGINSTTVAVLFIDLDDFKTVNDGLGHDVGDELLQIIAFRLATFVRTGDLAARLGGDEFAVLFENFDTTEDIMAAAGRLLEVITEPAVFGDRELEVSASIGVAIAETDNDEAADVLRNADVAMYHSKRTGKNRIKLFDQAMYISAFERLELKGYLTHALERDELELHYQPIIRLVDNSLIGFEALMRWTHPERGSVPPGSFVPLAEESGLIVPMGRWALRQACTQLKAWQAVHSMPHPLTMNVNVSPRQLDSDQIVRDVEFALESSGLDPAHLVLELTESAGLEDSASKRRFRKLRDLGCQLAADDFGAGFASYAALQELPFTNVKIDRSLVSGLSLHHARAVVQIESIVQMAHRIGLSITAEGVEEIEQRDTLMQLGADCAQGYLIGRPESAGATMAYLNTLFSLNHH